MDSVYRPHTKEKQFEFLALLRAPHEDQVVSCVPELSMARVRASAWLLTVSAMLHPCHSVKVLYIYILTTIH